MSYIPQSLLVHKTVLTRAQINALDTVPVTVLPAPPIGFTNVVKSITGDFTSAGAPLFVSQSLGYFTKVSNQFSFTVLSDSGTSFQTPSHEEAYSPAGDFAVNYDLRVGSLGGTITGGNPSSTFTVLVAYYQVKIS